MPIHLFALLAAGLALLIGAAPVQAGSGNHWRSWFSPQSSGPNYPRPGADGLMPSANWVYGTTAGHPAYRFKCLQAQFNNNHADIRAFCPDRFWW